MTHIRLKLCCSVVAIGLQATASDWQSSFSAGEAGYLQGHLVEAQRSYELAAEEAEAFTPGDTRRARSFLALALVLREQADFHKSETLYKRVLSESEAVFGERHPQTVAALNGLALLYCDSRRFSDAETILERALETTKFSFGPRSRQFGFAL